MRWTLALAICPILFALVAAPAALADDLVTLIETDPEAALEQLRREGATPGEVVERLRRVEVAEGPFERDSKIEITSGERTSVARVLVPENYDPAKPTPLMIALHGKGGDEDQLPPLFQPAVERGWLLACPGALRAEGTGDLGLTLMSRFGDGTWWTHGEDNLALATLREMTKRFHVDPDRVVLVGYSMGGFGTWNVGLRYHHRFAGLAPMAGGLSLLEYTRVKDRRSRMLLGNARNLDLFVMHGTADGTVPAQSDIWNHEDLDRLGYEHRWHLIEGGSHYLPFIRREGEAYRDFWRWLDGCRRDPAPREMVHVSIEDGARTGNWVEVLDAPDKVAVAVAGRIEDNKLVVQTRRVERMRVFLTPGMVDVAAPVSVVVDGTIVHEEKVQPTLEAVVASWRAFRGDRSKVTAYAVVVEP